MPTMKQPATYVQLLDRAVSAALRAGAVIMQHYDTSISVMAKSDKSPVTVADLAAHDSILAYLADTGFPAISEEGGNHSYDERKNWRKYWLIDPLDGTKEFIHRNGEFTVNIALVEDGVPVLGVVYAPATGELYAGCKELGAWYIPNADAVAAGPVDFTDFQIQEVESSSPQVHTIAVSRSHLDQETINYIEKRKLELGDVRTIAAGSSMKFCLVASGKADEYPRFGPTYEWDTAAGHAVLLALGKGVFSFPDGTSFVYNKPNLLNGPFLAR